jgi:predicted phage terminase large subunit-like protein
MCVLEDARLRLVARIAPRGHAKSTCAAFAYPLWCICQQQRRNIVVVTHESELARQFVRDIRTELESNERILAKYGDLCRAEEGEEGTKGRNPNRRRRGRWSDVQFTTVTGITVQAKGAGAAFRGLRVGPHRPDLIICDDLEKDKHIESAAMRRKLENWLRRVVMPALSPDGKLLVLGSLLHYDSLLANLRDRQRFPRWDYAVYRALEAEPGPDGQYQRVALWPARWPVERLDEERERIGSVAFEQEYQANPIDETRRAFCPEWLQRYEPQELVPERLVNVMAVDPATGSSGGDYFALWVGSVDSESGVIYTRQLTLERIGVVAQVKRIVAAFQRWRPVVVGIETVGYQKALLQAVEEESRRRKLYMPLVGIRPAGSKVARIESSAILYADGRFRLPPVLDPECEQQFLHFPKAAHDDAPDVCAMGIELVRGLHLGAAAEGAVAPWDAHDRRGGW